MDISQQLPRDELTKLPYLEVLPEDGRIVELRSFYDHGAEDWFLYMPVAEGELGRIGGGEVASGSFFSGGSVDKKRDFHFATSSIVAKHLSFPGASVITTRLESDLQQMAAVLGKLDLIVGSDTITDDQKRALLEAELEYVFGLSRSFYDLLQRLIRRLGRTVHGGPDGENRSFSDLPDSFAKVALDGRTKEPRSAEAIIEKWGLFPAIAQFYEDEAAWFQVLRQGRDGIYHQGKTVSSIFLLTEGAAVRVLDDPWKDFRFWDDTVLIRDSLGSVRALVGHVFEHTIRATDAFMTAFLKQVAVPPSLGAQMDVFVRSPYSHYLVELPEVIANPWKE